MLFLQFSQHFGFILGLALALATAGAPGFTVVHAARCVLVAQVLPDPSCTPGVIDERVTQENVQSTICVSGYTRTVRPSTSYTNRLKRQGILDYGYEDTNPQHYEEDHLVPLELGGHPTDPGNLWPEPGASPNAKDRFENALHQAVGVRQVLSDLLTLSVNYGFSNSVPVSEELRGWSAQLSTTIRF